MLILSRREGESICIGNDVEVVILDRNKYGQVRVGINAPKDISVVRGELLGDDNPSDNLGNR